MAFNPLDQKGIPVPEQFRNWSELNITPYDKQTVDPYTRTRVILMNGIEVESIIFSHQFSRHTDHPELKRALALGRRADAMQQRAVNGLNPGDQNPLETTIGYEQVAVDLTAWLARHEPDPYIKQSLDFALLEDFDHLYRYANLYELLEGGHADAITEHLTEITPGRPTILEHRHPHDDVRRHYDTHAVDPLSRMHVMTITAAEQQTMNFYMNHGTRLDRADRPGPLRRDLADRGTARHPLRVAAGPPRLVDRQWVFHEYNEVYLYWSMLQQESDRRIKAIWELHCDMEIGQLQVACDFMRRLEGREPADLLPSFLPGVPVTFEANKDYVRQVLADQVDLRSDGTTYVDLADLPAGHRYFEYQETVNAGGAPSEQVIDENRTSNGHEYRDETEGPHPVADLQPQHAS